MSRYECNMNGSRYENSQEATRTQMSKFDQITKRARYNHYKYGVKMTPNQKKTYDFIKYVEEECNFELMQFQKDLIKAFVENPDAKIVFPKGRML